MGSTERLSIMFQFLSHYYFALVNSFMSIGSKIKFLKFTNFNIFYIEFGLVTNNLTLILQKLKLLTMEIF